MSLERMAGPMGAEPAPPGVGEPGDAGSPVALRLQVLATELWGYATDAAGDAEAD